MPCCSPVRLGFWSSQGGSMASTSRASACPPPVAAMHALPGCSDANLGGCNAGEKVDRRGTLAGGYQDDRKSQMKLHRSVAEHSEGLAQKEEQRRDMRTRLNQADTDITKLTSEVRLPVRLFALIPRGRPEAAWPHCWEPSLPWRFR